MCVDHDPSTVQMDGSVVIHGSHSELNVDRSLGRMKSELYQSHSKQRGVNTPRSKPTNDSEQEEEDRVSEWLDETKG